MIRPEGQHDPANVDRRDLLDMPQRLDADGAELQNVADTYESKYGRRVTAPDGTWFGLGDAIRGGDALVYRVAPSTAFGFGKGSQFSQTRWRFP